MPIPRSRHCIERESVYARILISIVLTQEMSETKNGFFNVSKISKGVRYVKNKVFQLLVDPATAQQVVGMLTGM